MVVFDTTMMLLLMRSDVDVPPDPKTKLPVEHAEARISGLVQELEKQKIKIIVPAPALSELLIHAGDSEKTLITTLQKSSVFNIEPFDTLAAIEAAAMTRQAIKSGDKRGGVDCSWTKLKYDRQIVAIAKVHGATAIYSDDSHIHAHCEKTKIKAIRLADLPIPKDLAQGALFDKLKPDADIVDGPISAIRESIFDETEDQADKEPTE